MLINALSKLGSISKDKYEQSLKKLPIQISGREAQMLIMLSERAPVPPKEVAEHFDVTPSLITRYITSLSDKGLIRRKQGKQLRSFDLVVTPEGYNVAELLANEREALNQAMLDALTQEEQALLMTIIDKLTRI